MADATLTEAFGGFLGFGSGLPIAPALATDSGGVFTSGVARGVDQTQAMLFGFAQVVGEATGFDMLAEFGEEGVARNLQEIQENPARIESWDDVESLANFHDYIAERLGEQVPLMASVLGTGGLGGAIAAARGAATLAAKAAVGKGLKNKIGRAAFAEYEKTVARKRLLGQRAGAGAAAFALGTGETGIELASRGISAPGTAFTAGAV